MANWIWKGGAWHILGRVDKGGWATKCGELVIGDARVVDEAPPKHERQCLRCIDLEKEPVP